MEVGLCERWRGWWVKCGSPAAWCRWRRMREECGTNRRSGGWRKHGGGGATKGAGCGAVGAWISGVKWGNPRESGGSDKLEPGHSLWKLPKESAHGYGACTRAVRGLVGRGAAGTRGSCWRLGSEKPAAKWAEPTPSSDGARKNTRHRSKIGRTKQWSKEGWAADSQGRCGRFAGRGAEARKRGRDG